MGASVREVFGELATQLTAATGLSVIKGYPDWGRTAVVLPVAALELAAVPPPVGARIGQQPAKRDVVWRVYVFGRNEPELCDLVGLMHTFSQTVAGLMMVNEQRVALRLQNAERYTPEAGVQQERHAFVYQYGSSW